MGWLDYYWLIEKYDGDLSAATREELEAAARANPNDPESARGIAQEAYERRRALGSAQSGHEEQGRPACAASAGRPHVTACTPGYLELPAEARAAAECEFFARTGEQMDSLIILLGGRVYAQANHEEPGSYTLMRADEY